MEVEEIDINNKTYMHLTVPKTHLNDYLRSQTSLIEPGDIMGDIQEDPTDSSKYLMIVKKADG